MTLLRVYRPDECGPDGYPFAWHHESVAADQSNRYHGDGPLLEPAIKDWIRENADYRCVRCGHPYRPGDERISPGGEWSPCDDGCVHDRVVVDPEPEWWYFPGDGTREHKTWPYWSQWRILTVHHLNGIKADCRWWNLAALCQRCHLTIQGRVVMERAFILEHSDWFKPYAAGWYAAKYLGEDLTREETLERLGELLDLERLDGLETSDRVR